MFGYDFQKYTAGAGNLNCYLMLIKDNNLKIIMILCYL